MQTAIPPPDGVWRVARGPDPLALKPPLPREDLDGAATGNRFDSALGTFGVRYFASSLDGCFGETLSRFRPDPRIVELGPDWAGMAVGEVPADWRHRRLAVRVSFPDAGKLPEGVRFLDVEALKTRQKLRSELAEILAFFGFDDLDVPTVRGGDRRITRWISQWAYENHYAGVRYLSRLNSDWECWAVFHDVDITEVERRGINEGDEALARIAKSFDLRVF